MNAYYYIARSTDPYTNLALEDLLLRQAQPNCVLLYLWQNENTVVIGRNQNAWQECHLEAFAAENGRLARRMTGGGAVYHDLGNLNFSFIAPPGLYDRKRQTAVVCRAVSSFGIAAEPSGRNDILSNGRKFSGNAYHKTKYAALQHGTLLLSSDLTRLTRFLAPSPEKLAAKGVESVHARVMNLCEQNPSLTVEAMQAALLTAFGELYNCTPLPLPEDSLNLAAWDALTRHYASEAWCVGVQSKFDLRLKKRFTFGELELLLQVESGVVKQAKVLSDAMDADWVSALEAALLGCAYRSDALAAAVPSGEACEELRSYLCSLHEKS